MESERAQPAAGGAARLLRPARGLPRLLLRLVLRVAVVVLLAIAAGVALYRFVAPPATPLMLLRAAEGEGMHHRWVAIDAVSPNLLRAVVASEDARFCIHHGFDWVEIGHALRALRAEHRLRGASTISQQTAKNLFLLPVRSYLRKLVEAYATVLLELMWSKTRILETYLNIVEWGPGIFGAEAAAQASFHRHASELTRRQAALLAAILPNPRRWSAARPSAHVEERARTIEARMAGVPLRGHEICP
jgi:monofunctional biosynthetic peptidoglycan transglycosylase